MSRRWAVWLICGCLIFFGRNGAAQETGKEGEGPWKFKILGERTGNEAERVAWKSSDLPEIKGPAWSVRMKTLHGGKQEGVQVVEVENGACTIVVCPTRGMSVVEVRHPKARLGWNSPVKELVHPTWIDLDSRGGLGWLDGFNEFVVRCGLEYAGQAGKDEFVDNTGAKAEMNLTLHGKIGNLPASEVELWVDRRPPHTLRLRGVVHERMFYGAKLELKTELATVPGQASFRLEDEVTNRGGSTAEMQLIYHINYGRPLLEAGAQALTAAKSVKPMNENAEKGLKDYGRYVGPTAGFVEQVYFIEPLADRDGRAHAVLKNAAGDLGSFVRWSTAELPYFTLWKNTAAEADGYVTGLEPATGFPNHRQVERAAGRVPKLAPGQSRTFSVEIGLLVGKDQVDHAAAAVSALQPQP